MAPFLVFTPGTDLVTLRTQIALAKAGIVDALAQGLLTGGNQVARNLSLAAPIGKGEEGPPIPGDAPGRLLTSFCAVPTSQLTVEVRTSQPNKLALVVKGRKEVVPVTKRALMWPGLPHPVMRSRAVAPNDFVSPVLDSAEADIKEMVLAPVEALLQAL